LQQKRFSNNYINNISIACKNLYVVDDHITKICDTKKCSSKNNNLYCTFMWKTAKIVTSLSRIFTNSDIGHRLYAFGLYVCDHLPRSPSGIAINKSVSFLATILDNEMSMWEGICLRN